MSIAQKLKERNPDMFDKVMSMKDKQYQEHADWLLSRQEFNLQIESQNKFLQGLADKYGLRRELMRIEG